MNDILQTWAYLIFTCVGGGGGGAEEWRQRELLKNWTFAFVELRWGFLRCQIFETNF